MRFKAQNVFTFVFTHHILMVFTVTDPRKVEIISCYSTFNCMLSMISSFFCIAMLLKNCIIFLLQVTCAITEQIFAGFRLKYHSLVLTLISNW